MNIEKISIIDQGLRGLKIVGTRADTKEGRTSMTPCSEEPKFPIHLGLEKLFKSLTPYLLEIAGHLGNPEEKDYIVQDTEMVSIKIGDDSFLLSGKRKMTESGKKIAVNTYLVEPGDDYHDFDKVMGIIREILVETVEYMKGNRSITESEMGERIIASLIKKGKKSEEDLKEFQDMSDEEKKAYCTEWLEDNNCLVTRLEDLEISDETPVVELHAKVG